MIQLPLLKGRGAQINTPNPFETTFQELDPQELAERSIGDLKTRYQIIAPKSIVTKVPSPDVPMSYSINPYQGCEHGCIYCYARNSHNYWGYSAGLDFERVILVKKNAPALLAKYLRKKNWQASPIMLSGNTDCYQPAEKKFRITRQLLEIFWKYKHPVGIITKNSLILDDLELLKKLAEKKLVQVVLSITSLDDEIRKKVEPRTASISKRLKTLKILRENNIPVFIMMAPIIPSINDYEILPLAKKVASLGASGIGYTIVRLNGAIAELFKDWIQKVYPERSKKVLSQIEELHGGKLDDSRFGTRMRGEGKYADLIKQQFQIARKNYFRLGDSANIPESKFSFNLSEYEKVKNPQLSLF